MNDILACKNCGLSPNSLWSRVFVVCLLVVLADKAHGATCTATSGSWNTVGIWDCGHVPVNTDAVVIPNGATVILNVDSNRISDLNINAGGVLRGDNTNNIFTIDKGAGTDITNNGTIDFGPGNLATIFVRRNSQWTGTGTWNLSTVDLNLKTLTFAAGSTLTLNIGGVAAPILNPGIVTSLSTITWNFNGAVAQTLPANINVQYGNLTVSNTAGTTLGIALTTNILGNLTVATNGILNNGGFAITLPAGKSLAVQAAGQLNLSGASTMVTVAGGGTKAFNATSTVSYSGTSNQNVTAETYGNLVFDGGTIKTLATGTTTIAGSLTVNASTTYNGTTNSPVVNLAGNFTNSGTFNSGTGVFTFNGTAAQSLTGATTFSNMTMNNAAGLTINNNATVSSVLTLTSGVVSTGANTLVASANCPASIVRTGGRVFGNLQMTFPVTDPVTCVYYVGDSNNYAPITITKTGANSGTLVGSSTSGDHADTTAGTSGISAARGVNRYWTLTGGTLASGTPYSATFQFCSAIGAGCGVNDVDAAATPANFIVAKKTGGSWTLPTVGSVTATTTQATGLSTFGEFAVGERALDHYEMSLQTSSITCLPSTVTVAACADASSPCTNLATIASGTTATLATSAGTLGATTVTFNASGVASTTLSYPAATDGATATVTLSGEQLSAVNPRQCCPDGVSCVAANSCSSTFNTAGFIFSSAANGIAATIPTQMAGTSSLTYYLRAVKTSTTTKACESALVGANTVNFGYECNNPTTCYTSDLMSVNGGAATTVARNNNGSVTSYTSVNMTFDANGNAPFTFNYSDVGQLTLHVNKTVNSAPLTGVSNAFVVKPFGFVLSNIQATTLAGRCTVNPDSIPACALDATGARFAKAGEDFSATVTAVTATSSAAPNYGKEISPEGVILTRALVAPGSGAPGSLANSTAFGAFSSGAATGTTFNWSEVGIITLTPSVADGDYLGVGDITGTTSGNVGRFYPDHFLLTQGTLTNRSLSVCAPVSTFTYAGEQMQIATFTLTARNGAAAPTVNYNTANSFAKFDGSIIGNFNLGAVDLADAIAPLTATALTGSLNGVSSSGSWVAGVGTFTVNLSLNRAAIPDGPYESFSIGIVPTDTDGVQLNTYDVDTDLNASNDRGLIASAGKVRFGRLKLFNAHGSELRNLSVPFMAQYFNGTTFITNTADSCTQVLVPSVGNGDLIKTPSGLGTNATMNGIAAPSLGSFVAGDGKLKFSQPSPSANGYVDITIVDTPAYLKYDWNTTTAGLEFPSSRATFGVYKGRDEFIYLRENY